MLRFLASPLFLGCALAAGAAVRAANLFALRASPLFDRLQLDHRYYDDWAQRIAAGEWLGSGVFFVDPLYAYFLGGLYRVCGHDLLAVRLVQAALGLGTAWLTGLVARRVLASAALGNLACLVVALYVPGIHNEAVVEKTALGVFLFTAAVALYLERSRRGALLSGLALGFAVLARGNLLAMIPAGALAIALERWDARERTRLLARLELKRAFIFVAAAAAVVSLATVRNRAVGGEWVLVTSNAGQNLYLGHHRANETGTYHAPPFVQPDPRHEEEDFRAEAEKRLGRDLTPGEVSSYWTAQAFDEIRADPPAAVARTLRKLRLFWHQYETPDNTNLDIVAAYSPVMRLPVFWMGQLFPLALLGAVVLFRRNRGARELAIAAALYCAGVVAFFVLGRLRVQIVPIVAVLSVGGAAWLWQQGAAMLDERRRRVAGPWRARALAGAGLAAAAFFSLATPGWMRAMRETSLAIGFNNLGGLFLEAGDEARAIEAYERAIAVAPASVVASLRSLGELYLRRGELDEAEARMRQVLELKPDSRAGREALERLQAARTRVASPGGARELYARSRALRAEGRWSEAIAALQEAIRVGPYDEGARYLLGSLMEQHATADPMVDYWSRAVASDPKPQTSHYFWAVGLERQGRLDDAIARLRAGLEVDPAHEMSQLRWGQILDRQGRPAEALEHCEEAVQIHPEFKSALEACASLADRLGRIPLAADYRRRAATADPETARRYVYWARYLVKHGRFAAAIPELELALKADPADAEAKALLEQARANVRPADERPPGWTVAAQASFAQVIRGEPAGAPVWLEYDERDARSVALARAMREAFNAAGWKVRRFEPLSMRVKKGIFLFAAEAAAPRYVDTISRALRSAGLEPTFGTGYREYAASMAAQRPGWRGFQLGPDQSFILAIGPLP